MSWLDGVEWVGLTSVLWATGVAFAFNGTRTLTDLEVDKVRRSRGFSQRYFGFALPALIWVFGLLASSRLLAFLVDWPLGIDFLARTGWRLGFIGVGFLQGLWSLQYGAYGLSGGIYSGHAYFVLREDVKYVPSIAGVQIVAALLAAGSCLAHSI